MKTKDSWGNGDADDTAEYPIDHPCASFCSETCYKGSGSPARASRRAGPAPRPDALGHLLHKGASKIVRLVTGKK